MILESVASGKLCLKNLQIFENFIINQTKAYGVIMAKDLNSLLEYEKYYLSQGYKYIAGTDEVGRGPLAGAVFCAAVIMPLDDLIEGIDDSKKLSEKKRELLYPIIMQKALAVSVCSVEADEIDSLNILNATKKCMCQAVNQLSIKPDILLVDALKLDVDCPQKLIIHGDALSYNIAAASIVAKVVRDRQMLEYDKLYPEYKFAKNKGYGTKEHIAALKEFGALSIHRRSFIKNFNTFDRKI